MGDTSTHGLTCPACGGIVPVRDGDGVVRCPYCEQHSLVQGERGVRRWQVPRQVTRARALLAVKEFFLGVKKAPDLRRTGDVQEVFAVYVPYWRVSAFVAGWRLGREKWGEDSTRPVEVQTMEQMHWTDAAADVSELGVHSVALSGEDLEPYAPDALHREAMVFDPSESRTRAMAEAEQHFTYRARKKKQLKATFLERYHFLRRELSLVYYPLWVARYVYRKRTYQVVVDGVRGLVLYGRAPGNLLYRAVALVVGMAVGNLLLVHGTALASRVIGEDGDGAALLALSIGAGIGFVLAGYRAFRHGEQIEEVHEEAKKASVSDEASVLSGLPGARVAATIEDWLR